VPSHHAIHHDGIIIHSSDIIINDNPDQIHSIPFESELNKTLSPCGIVTSDLAQYLDKAMTTPIRDAFIWEHHLPTCVQIAMEQPFGKDSCLQSFFSEVTFRHTIPYLYNFGWLSKQDKKALEAACHLAKGYAILWKKHCRVDFCPARGYWSNWTDTKTLDGERKSMISACFLHYLCDTPIVIRYLRGAYVLAHCDTEKILSFLQPIVDSNTFAELARLYRSGAPKNCNALATDKNFWQAVHYGNHKSIDLAPAKTRKSVTKDCRRGYAISIDMLLLPYIPHTHVTPQGVVDLDKRFKTPRPVFDSTFRATESSFAINDWTSKKTEPPVTFAKSFLCFLVWLWNLRISYLHLELYPHDDDMTSGFRQPTENTIQILLECMHTYCMVHALWPQAKPLVIRGAPATLRLYHWHDNKLQDFCGLSIKSSPSQPTTFQLYNWHQPLTPLQLQHLFEPTLTHKIRVSLMSMAHASLPRLITMSMT
jgi:hypothetical protein